MGLFITLTVDEERCSTEEACRECVQVCPVDVFDRDPGAPARVLPENEDECILCDQCVVGCPVEAITLVRNY